MPLPDAFAHSKSSGRDSAFQKTHNLENASNSGGSVMRIGYLEEVEDHSTSPNSSRINPCRRPTSTASTSSNSESPMSSSSTREILQKLLTTQIQMCKALENLVNRPVPSDLPPINASRILLFMAIPSHYVPFNLDNLKPTILMDRIISTVNAVRIASLKFGFSEENVLIELTSFSRGRVEQFLRDDFTILREDLCPEKDIFAALRYLLFHKFVEDVKDARLALSYSKFRNGESLLAGLRRMRRTAMFVEPYDEPSAVQYLKGKLLSSNYTTALAQLEAPFKTLIDQAVFLIETFGAGKC